MATDAERVRDLLGEPIPEGGSDTDTLFSSQKITDLLTDAGGDVEAAVAEGWRVKAALLADLVDTTEGTSKRAMSNLHKNALAMAQASGTPSPTRLQKIVRR